MVLASKDMTRMRLNGIYLWSEDGKTVKMQVTDGHRAVIESYRSEDWCQVLALKPIFISRESLPILKVAVKGHYAEAVTRNENVITINNTPIPIETDLDMPNVAKIMPSEGKHKVAFNAKYLVEIAKALESSHDGVVVSFDLDDDGRASKPLHITSCGNEKTAVLMPVRHWSPS